jgi:hypothetical protein
MRDSGVAGMLLCFVTAVTGVLAEANADAGAEGCPGASAGGERALGAAGCGTAAGMNPTEALVLSQVVLSSASRSPWCRWCCSPAAVT